MSAQHWRDRAACKDEDAELFATNDREGITTAKVDMIREAKAICKRCPVQAECLERARQLGSEAWGVWGGLTDTERGELPKNGVRMGGLPDAPCGTESGYRRHYRSGDGNPCGPCREAASLARRVREGRQEMSA